MITNSLTPIIQVGVLGIGKLAFLGVTIVLYKALSVRDIGYFAIAYAIAVILATISECGLRGLLVREMARSHEDPEISKELLACALQSRLLTLLPYLVLGWIAGLLFLPGDQWMVLLLLLGAAWLDSNAFVFRGALRAHNYIITDALVSGGARLMLLALTALLYWQQQLTLLSFALLFSMVAFADVIVTLGYIIKKTKLRLTLDTGLAKSIALVKRGTPFVILNAIGILYIRIGLLMLGVAHSGAGLDEAAAMSLSARIPEGVSFLPIALMNAAIPYFARNCGNLANITPMFRKLEMVMGSAGIIISAGLVIFADEFILLLATPQYLPYKMVFQIYGLTIFFSFLQYVYANLLICMDQEKRVARRYGIVLALNIVINLVLVWKFKALGAVIALLICEITALTVDMRFVIKSGIRPNPALLLRWASLAALCVGLGWAANQLPNPFNLALYWISGGLIGVIILLKAQLSQHNSRAA